MFKKSRKLASPSFGSTISSLFARIVVIMAMFMVLACEKDETVMDKSPSLRDPKSVLYNLKVDENGIIVFKDYEEYNQSLKYLKELNQKERLEWESTIGFKSYLTWMLVAAREIDDAETEQEFFVLMNKHAKYFYLEKLKTRENSVESRDQTTLYSTFSNEEGMFVIGDSVYRVMNNNWAQINY